MKDNLVYIEHIQSCIDRIISYADDLDYDSFIKNQLVQDAIVRQLEIIGEAPKRISAEFRISHPNIPWKVMAGMRDKLIHDYIDVDIRMVWSTVKEDIPELNRLFKGLS